MAIMHIARTLRYVALGKLQHRRNLAKGISSDPRFGVTSVYVGLRMMDAFMHVNNSRYLEICEFGRWHSLSTNPVFASVFRPRTGGVPSPRPIPTSAKPTAEAGAAPTSAAKVEEREKKFVAPCETNDDAAGGSGGRYSFVLSSCHIQYLRPLGCFQFARVETSLVGMTLGGRGWWMQHRIYDAKRKLAAEALFKVTFIRWQDARSVSVKEALTRSYVFDELLAASLKAEAVDPALNADLRGKEKALGAALTAQEQEDIHYTRVLRRFFVFGERVVSRETTPAVFAHHPHLCFYDEGELSERQGMRYQQPLNDATAQKANLESAPPEKPLTSKAR
jgi:acyl-CoA thioesterase FadM